MNQLESRNAADLEELIGELAEDFAQRLLRGERPTVEDYAARHPEAAEALRQILPALEVMGAMPAIDRSENLAAPADESERTLGDFRLIREIGRGGMGVVYEAEQLSIGRRVALKVLPFAAMLDKQQLARFKNEARAAATLDHPNIVQIHSVGVERGVHYYAMHLVEGESLAQVIARLRSDRQLRNADCGLRNEDQDATVAHQTAIRNPQSEIPARHPQSEIPTAVAALSTRPDANLHEYFRTVARLGIQAAEALDHAHAHGILHRDVKPANLLVECGHLAPRDDIRLAERDDYKLWITDFGLARLETDAGLTMTGDLIGTLRYMSPEQTLAQRGIVDHRSDVYSLGATLYELLTLEPAFPASDRHELLRQIAFEEPRKPRQIDPQIPRELETIVLKAIHKDAAGRYATAQDLADDLERHLDGRPIVARPPTTIDRIVMWTRRHAFVAAGGSLALVVIVGVCLAAAALTYRAYQSESQQRAAADARLAIAAASIDRMLTRVAEDRYFHGDLAHAETVAADATEFYGQLLEHSSDPRLRLRAARAQNQAADIWILLGQTEKALAAYRHSIELVAPHIATPPAGADYLAARANSYQGIGEALWELHRASESREPFQQAAADYQLLVDHAPNEASFRLGLANALNNLGAYCLAISDWSGAAEAFESANQLIERVPDEIHDSAVGLTSRANLLANRALLARLRGDLDDASSLLKRAVALQRESLADWADNPVAAEGLYKQYWNVGETYLSAEQPAAVVAAVEQFIAAFPNRLEAYVDGAEQLLRCADLISNPRPAPSPRRGGLGRGSEAGTSDAIPPPLASLHQGEGDGARYRQRAHELIAKAHDAPQRTPDSIEQFARLLLLCEDRSLRDPPRALKLAKRVVEEVPERGGAWFTLALAHYRNGDWQAADGAVQNSIKFAHDAQTNACAWALLSMIRVQQGRLEEARQWHKKADDWIAANNPNDRELSGLALEAGKLIHSAASDPTKALTSEKQSP